MSFFFIDCKKYVDNQSILLHGLKMDTETRYSFFVDDFFPYIGIKNTDENIKKILELEKKRLIIRKEFFLPGTNVAFHDQFGYFVIKVFLKSTDLVNIVRPLFDVTYQDDVQYEKVFRTTKNIHVGFILEKYQEILKRTKFCPDSLKKFSKNYTNFIRVSEKLIIGF